jgi:hypothetical protein
MFYDSDTTCLPCMSCPSHTQSSETESVIKLIAGPLGIQVELEGLACPKPSIQAPVTS